MFWLLVKSALTIGLIRFCSSCIKKLVNSRAGFELLFSRKKWTIAELSYDFTVRTDCRSCHCLLKIAWTVSQHCLVSATWCYFITERIQRNYMTSSWSNIWSELVKIQKLKPLYFYFWNEINFKSCKDCLIIKTLPAFFRMLSTLETVFLVEVWLLSG